MIFPIVLLLLFAENIRYVKVNSICALTTAAKRDLARAILDDDREAMKGLILRGKAIYLEKGTKFDDASPGKDGFTFGFVRSGRETGQSCHLPKAVLQDTQP